MSAYLISALYLHDWALVLVYTYMTIILQRVLIFSMNIKFEDQPVHPGLYFISARLLSGEGAFARSLVSLSALKYLNDKM